MMGLMASWAATMASTISVSLASAPSPSTMVTASAVAATTRLSFAPSCSANVGLMTYLPLMRQTRQAPTATAQMAASFWRSKDRTVAMSWISQRQVLGKSGRMGRSIRRALRISHGPGRDSRLK